MWLMTAIGFYSITQVPGSGASWDIGTFQVRSRRRQDLENLQRWTGQEDTTIVHTPDADYEWRIVIDRLRLKQITRALATTIDYPNFKAAVEDEPGQQDHSKAYHTVWAVMRRALDQRSTGPVRPEDLSSKSIGEQGLYFLDEGVMLQATEIGDEDGWQAAAEQERLKIQGDEQCPVCGGASYHDAWCPAIDDN